MKVLFEDESIIVIIKPVGIASEGASNNVCDEVKNYLLKNNSEANAFVVHRLDRNVGGIMVLAKTKEAAADLSGQIQNNQFDKRYYAVIHGSPDEAEGVFEDLLFKDSKNNKSFVVKRMRRGVKKAKLEYKVISASETELGLISLVDIHLFTGRTHQIRVQFSSRKLPLVGDGKYGGSDNCNIGLFEYKLSFFHPKTHKHLSFDAKPGSCSPWNLVEDI